MRGWKRIVGIVVFGKCNQCHGKKTITDWDGKKITCPTCDGTGESND